jgi:hypothetical protein
MEIDRGFEMSNTSGRNAAAIGLIGLGVLFLLVQITNFSFMGLLWPFFIIGPGLVFLYFAFASPKQAGLAIPGAMITGTGGILLYQNLTNHWESWAYIWALYPVFLGLALVFMGRRTGHRDQVQKGDGLVKFGLFGFIALWAVFELFIFGGNSALITTILPFALIIAGIVLLMRGRSSEKPKVAEAKAKYSNGRPTHSDSLQDKIDAALAESDDEPRIV